MEQIESLHIILAEMLPTQDDSRLERGKGDIKPTPRLRSRKHNEDSPRLYRDPDIFYYTATLSAFTTYDRYYFEINKKRNITWWAPPYGV